MKTVILGYVEDPSYFEKYNRESNKSLHMKKRVKRLMLSLESAKPLNYYEVYRKEDNERQVHCLYEDSSLVVFNKETGLIVTIILLERDKLEEYLVMNNETAQDYPRTLRCSKIHEKFNKIKGHIADELIIEYKDKKLKQFN